MSTFHVSCSTFVFVEKSLQPVKKCDSIFIYLNTQLFPATTTHIFFSFELFELFLKQNCQRQKYQQPSSSCPHFSLPSIQIMSFKLSLFSQQNMKDILGEYFSQRFTEQQYKSWLLQYFLPFLGVSLDITVSLLVTILYYYY